MQSATQWTNSTLASCPGTPQLQAAGWLFVLLPSPSLEASGRKVADPVLGNINLFKSPFTQFLSALLKVPLGPEPATTPPLKSVQNSQKGRTLAGEGEATEAL